MLASCSTVSPARSLQLVQFIALQLDTFGIQHCMLVYKSFTGVQLMEDLEQLKVIENGYKIKVIVVDHKAHGVDEPEDVAVIEQKMRELGLT